MEKKTYKMRDSQREIFQHKTIMSREFAANDSTGKIKKAHQSIGRPEVVDDFHEEYLKNPPNVRPCIIKEIYPD